MPPAMEWSKINEVLLPLVEGGASIIGWVIGFGFLGLLLGIVVLILGYRAAVACHWPTESRAWGKWARRAVGALALFTLLGSFTMAGAGWGTAFGLKRHVASKQLVEQASEVGLEPIVTAVCALLVSDKLDLAGGEDVSQDVESLVATFREQGGTIPLAKIESEVAGLKEAMIRTVFWDVERDGSGDGKISGLANFIFEKALTWLMNASVSESEKQLKEVLAELRKNGIENAAPKEIAGAIGKVHLRPYVLDSISGFGKTQLLFTLLPGLLTVFVAILLCDVVARILKCHCGTSPLDAVR